MPEKDTRIIIIRPLGPWKLKRGGRVIAEIVCIRQLYEKREMKIGGNHS